MYWDRWGPEIPGLSVRCLCVSVSVSSRQYGETTGLISMKLSKNDLRQFCLENTGLSVQLSVYLPVCLSVCLSASLYVRLLEIQCRNYWPNFYKLINFKKNNVPSLSLCLFVCLLALKRSNAAITGPIKMKLSKKDFLYVKQNNHYGWSVLFVCLSICM